MSGDGTIAVPRGDRAFHAPVPTNRKLSEHVRIWWREIDKWLLFLILLVMALGTVAVAAAAPAASEQLARRGVEVGEFHYLRQHIMWQVMGIGGMIFVSFMDRDTARRLGILVFVGFLLLLFLVPIIGVEKNGARRWLEFGMSLQPSEFLKPGFAVMLAWILSWKLRDQNLPVLTFVTAIMALIAGLLMLQPNLGATILFGGIWFVLVLLAGVSIQRISALIGAGLVGLTATYFLYDNARYRIDSFLGGGTAFDQVDLAQRTLLSGGWTGSGLWLGVRKMNLPEPHTDYIFSVIGEEFGLLMCGLIVLLYLAIIGKALMRLVDEENLFALLAGAGLVTQIGGQAFINILVNLQLFPSKGMTLPLISYGGSSTLAVCFTVGLLLAITRRNPFLERESSGLKDLFDRPKSGHREERA
ncbi:putative peptidoglycan glycosyltransferase FtsW [Erythrobacter sp. F6033]|uniref:FtsW/RodA/SpoVE family cell cycle protein n=1 Tax=Erythrobacter sp. F6033 TaxID=2926401 RepID=UPI001FF23FF9|nr:putative peptidoglycan glycosyltransferase FtsW [Erythrobacter sp. F6033]MCK0129014.1 putative lipid II flippase FtsW [Erythrobacter sp. F6033]